MHRIRKNAGYSRPAQKWFVKIRPKNSAGLPARARQGSSGIAQRGRLISLVAASPSLFGQETELTEEVHLVEETEETELELVA